MYIKKQRLLTPGPTPLLPKALHAMMGSDIHHRTDDFRNVYRSVLADLKEVMGTSNDVLALVASGTGAMEASVSNLFSPGDRVIVCVAGKFGERWAEIAKAYGLDAIVLSEDYGKSVSAQRVAETLAANPNVRGVFVQASETSTGAAHDVRAMGQAIQKTGAIFVVDAITGLGTMPLDIDGWGLDVVIGGSQKAFMIPPGMAFLSISPKAWAFAETSKLPRYYFNLKKEKKNAAGGESSWTPNTSLVLALAEALKYVKSLGMDKLVANAQQLAAATRSAAGALGLELFSPESPCAAVTADQGAEGHGFQRHREGISQPLWLHHRQWPGLDERADLPHRASGLFRFRRSFRGDCGAGNHPRGQRRAGEIRNRRGCGAECLRRRGASERNRRRLIRTPCEFC